MKKVAITYNTSWYIYNFRKELIELLQSNGYQVITVAPNDYFTNKLIGLGCIHYHYSLNRRGFNPLEEVKLFIKYLSIYNKTKPDLILHFTVKPVIYGSIAAGLLRIPTVNNITGLATLFIRPNLLTAISKKLYKFSQQFASIVFFQNSDDLILFTEKLKLLNVNKADLLPGSGVNLKKFTPIPKENIKSNFIFLLISRMIYDKGIKEFVDAAKILLDKGYLAEFQLLGPLDYENVSGIRYNDIINWEKHGVIKYLGTTNNVKKYIRDSDCVVLPSYREGTPRSLLEAAAMGKPLITTNTIGCKEVVDNNKNGFLCKLKDPLDLANKMEKMLKLTKTQRIKMGENSRKKIEDQFDEIIVINKYLDAINQLIGN